MKRILDDLVKVKYVVMIALLWGCHGSPQSPSSYPGMKLVWADEFDYTGAPDPAKWGYDYGNGCPDLCGWGNNELQTYTDQDANIRVENGNLIVEAHRENDSDDTYTSARLISRNKGDFLYGRYEIRAKLPVGKGTWAAIWMLPTASKYGKWPESGEIDIMEYVGYEADTVYQTLHTGAFNGMYGTQKGGSLMIPDGSETFHTYILDWTEDKMDFLIDNQLSLTFPREDNSTSKWPFDQPFYFIFNMAVGGNWGGKHGVDRDIWPQKMMIDYIRVYQNDEQIALNSKE